MYAVHYWQRTDDIRYTRKVTIQVFLKVSALIVAALLRRDPVHQPEIQKI